LNQSRKPTLRAERRPFTFQLMIFMAEGAEPIAGPAATANYRHA
jgi:hypothetical protein